jgi:DNA-binding PadR family transcriptional regulator
MRKIFDHSKWNATTPERRAQILRILQKQDNTFTGILRQLDKLTTGLGRKRWSRLTLTLYLKAMVEDGWIKHGEKRGVYSLNRRNHKVAKMLGIDSLSHDLRLKNRANLNEMDEEEFILDWLASLKFGFLSIIQDYMLIGKTSVGGNRKVEIQQFMQAHVQNIADIIASYGEVMVKQMESGKMKEEKILKIYNELRKNAAGSLAKV